MASSSLEADLDRLYQLPLAEFTAARNALAKQAGSGGSEIRSLQKPPLAAWAVNQLYWKRRAVYDALVEAATTMRSAHSTVLAGKRADLRGVGKDHEDALEAALKGAVEVLEDSGQPVTDATRQAIATTLRGLPADDPPGRLTRTLQPGGFEMLAGLPLKAAAAAKGGRAAAPAARTAATPRRDADAARPDAEIKDLARAREELAAATRSLRVAEHTARREEFEAARASRDFDKATREVDTARALLEAAERTLADAERTAAEAGRARDAAQRRSGEAEAALTAAKDRVRRAERELARR